jgi:hypothetical protein
MQMRNAITRAVAPVTLASALLVLVSGWQLAEGKAAVSTCQTRFDGCTKRCLETYPLSKDKGASQGHSQGDACITRTCSKQYNNCTKAEGNKSGGGAGVKDTGGTGKPPKAGAGTTPGGGVVTDPRSPPKGTGTRAPVVGVYSQPSTTGSGGSGPILRSGGGKR